MTTPRGRNLSGQNPEVTAPAILPPLVHPRTGIASLDKFATALIERHAVREGSRNPWERVITARDMVNMGVAPASYVQSGRAPAVATSGGATGGVMMGNGQVLSNEAFAASILKTQLFSDLSRRLDDTSRFDALPDITRAILSQQLAPLDGKIDAVAQRTTQTIIDAQNSIAQEISVVRASVARAAAGVRQVRFASASDNHAVAGQVTQVVARLDGYPIDPSLIDGTVYVDLSHLTAAVTAPNMLTYYQVDDPASTDNFLYRWDGSAWTLVGHGTSGGGSAAVEEVLQATADRVTGLAAEAYLKVQAGDRVAGWGVSAVEDPSGASTSAFIVLADKFAVVTGSTTIVDPANPDAAFVPFGVDSSGAYVNGTLRVNSTGPTLASLAAATGVIVNFTSEFWKVDSSGAAVNTSITLTASLTGGLTGFVTWTKSGAGTAPPTAGTTNSWTINAADQTSDTNTYTATLVSGAVTYTDSVTIVRLRDGSTAVNAILTNETHTVAADASGGSVNYSGAGGTFLLYRGSTLLTNGTDGVTWSYVTSSGFSTPPTTSINSTTGVYSISANMNADVATVTYRATLGSATFDKIFTLTKALQGITGTTGSSGTAGVRTAVLDMYKWATSTPGTYPSGTSTYTWATGAFTAPGTPNGWALTPGVPGQGQTLYIIRQVFSDSLTTSTSTVTWSAGSSNIRQAGYTGVDGGDGTDGANGTRTAFLTLYKWSATTPATFPSGNSTYTWSTGAFTNPATLNGWSQTPGSPTAGQSLWAVSFRYADSLTTSTTSVTWPASPTPYTVGGAGTNGATGTRGTVVGYGTTYGIRVSIWDSTSDQYANRVVDDVANGLTASTVLASTAGNHIGDKVTLSNASPWIRTLGLYNSATTYNRGDLVLNTGGTIVYRCLQTSLGNVVTNTTYFTPWGNITSRGAWANSTAYAQNDAVSGLDFDGVTTTWFIANYAHTSSATPVIFTDERNGGGFVETRYWGGSAWLRPGLEVDGNLYVSQNISGGANIDIFGLARFGGNFTNADGSASVAVEANAPDLGAATGGPSGTGIYGWGGNGNGTEMSFGVIGSIYTTGTPVSGSAGVLGTGAGANTYGVKATQTSASASAAGLYAVGHNAGTGNAIEMVGKLKWRTAGVSSTAYTYTAPDGTATKVLAANGTWLDAGPALKVTGSAGTAGSSLGYLIVLRNDGSGGSVKIPAFNL